MKNNINSSQSRAGTLIYNSIMLCISSILIRTVGVSFNVYISNRVGAEAMGLYSLINNVFGFALTLASSGINLAVTRCVAESEGRRKETTGVMRKSVAMAAGFGILSAVLLFGFSGLIGKLWLKDPRATTPLRIMSLSLPTIAVSSALNGYFTAVRRAWKSASAQLAEQCVRIYATAGLLTFFLNSGPEFACIALVIGCAVSDSFSCLLSFFLYLFDRKKNVSEETLPERKYAITKKLLGIAMPVAFSAYVRSGLTTLEHVLIPMGLQMYGASRGEALADYGVISGMVLPVVLFPYALIYSFTGLLIPEIAGAASEKHENRIRYISCRVWRLTIVLGCACAGIMGVCSAEFGEYLYSNAEAGKYIAAMAPLLPVMYLDTVTDSLLKGLGEQVYTMNVNIADAAISVILVRLLVPVFGLNGYIAVLYISELINFTLSAARMIKRTGIRIKIFRWAVLPVACIIAVSRICCRFFNAFPLNNLPGWERLTVHIIILVLLFSLAVRVTGVFDGEYCRWIADSLKIGRNRKTTVGKTET